LLLINDMESADFTIDRRTVAAVIDPALRSQVWGSSSGLKVELPVSHISPSLGITAGSLPEKTSAAATANYRCDEGEIAANPQRGIGGGDGVRQGRILWEENVRTRQKRRGRLPNGARPLDWIM
jgi:hypothetical protein